MSSNPTDDEILAVLREKRGGTNPTYYIKNILRMGGHKELETPFVLRRLKALEQLGKVERSPSNYATQLCWNLLSEAK